ncbi:hydantoinase B/oxoprolinase family protein [Sabulicella glaciei]|uniref:Hydantoinase B/oxoprolinase family protein n=1 Tax=Sabulicella glaciei TaxID=2984948 RepID=A0ABT3P0X5_9PROT|nr:hydantoinase B/oxoprolinase family protein [Roseococcus sp. MDT2-1-1]MCW8087414.1 hydantoinase B/oxoprolinase family protein [Roseococcus sp. MDT2-1-1]
MPEAPIPDPITFAVVKNAMDSIVDEVAYTVIRTARSEIVKDVMDYSAAICDAKGEMVAQAKTIAQHLGAIPEAMAAVQARWGGRLQPGDAVIMNDPYSGGMHLPDIFMFFPVFAEGEVLAWVVVICHHTDVGGRVPGSNAADSTEIFQEGLRIPPLRLYREGEMDEALEALIGLNVRVPDRVLGDLRAQYAACGVGAREIASLVRRYGAAGLRGHFVALLDYAERMARAEIKTWPRGTYRFTDHIDSDGLSEEAVRLSVAVTVRDDGTLRVDWEGSSPQVRAAINSTLSFTKSNSFLSVRCALRGDIPNNAGVFRCVEVTAPEGSVLNPVSPAPVAARALTGYRVMDTMFGALAQIVPEVIPAAGEGGNTVVVLGGRHPDNRPFIIVDMISGCWGGRPDKDGVEAITNPSQNLSNTPVEVLERQHPVRVEEYALVADSGGPGRFRGGMGLARSYRLLAEEAVMQLRADRVRFGPYGLDGGQQGGRAGNWLDGAPVPGKVTGTMRRGQLLRHHQAGGGGHGDPRARDPEAVARDVWNGKVSAEAARRDYAVVVDGRTGILDRAETARLRERERA